jgi:hypothetical protein
MPSIGLINVLSHDMRVDAETREASLLCGPRQPSFLSLRIIAARWLRAKVTEKNTKEGLFTVILTILNKAEMCFNA